MIKVIEANETYYEKWDEFIQKSTNGTIFHTRKFLSYHGDRFSSGEQFLIILKNNTLIGQIAIFVNEINGKKVAVSPYGASYGGVVLQRQPSYSEGRAIISALIEYLKQNMISEFIITPPINCCSNVSLDTFYFNMLEQGFKIVNQDISSVVKFDDEPIIDRITSKARQFSRKAINNNIKVANESSDLDGYWVVMDKTFKKLGIKPTHTKEQLKNIMTLFPKRVFIDIAYKEDIPIAGITYFVINERVSSSFYLCQDPRYQKYQALTLLVTNALQKFERKGYKYFDFGTSSANMIARENIFSFKEQFSKSGYFRTTFKWQNSIVKY
ncbi:Acetyltransferase (GNAT) domain-containing protein [Hathewaya proteolytica DSM 3090]|uniref:Acetyltransferase (GNAT) domain-containing protein n=1 Tax=Hathewaya proteolytica DSM 3090 TaxID=1121331 RepID=A0A1M6JRQ0_9CLOT|nr:GNAT family N-acetyltransferase [Hathewaya proteolytica]SHJ49351.1 Acetyltransferase (GNAT) domain-containing protein [Hathewaya proteolytica DSM 3090]